MTDSTTSRAQLAADRARSKSDLLQVEACLDRLLTAYNSPTPDNQVIDREFSRLTVLYDESSQVARFRIASAIPAVQLPQSKDLLERALREDNSFLVRHEAAFGLGDTGDESTARLLTYVGLRDESPLVRHEAAMALAHIGGEPELPHLEEGLEDADEMVVMSCELAITSILYRLGR